MMMNENDPGAPTDFQKPPYDAVLKTSANKKGLHQVRGPVREAWIVSCNMAEGLCCFRPASRQHQALVELCSQPDGIVFVATKSNTILSYLSFHKPDFPWWQRRSFPRLLELGVMETEPAYRNLGLTTSLLEAVFKNPNFTYFEDYIVIAVQTVYSWDLKNTGLTAWDYRKKMFTLFNRYNFSSWETDDPEIKEHPCNVLMARIGKNTCRHDQKLFAGYCHESC